MRFTFVILLFLSLGADAQMIIKAHANYRPYAVAAQNLLLDDYPNAAAAYSLRKLRTAYTGSAIRVRKDTTGQPEQDIGFIGNDLDTASLKSFINANSGFIVRWYNQSGSATNRNAIQTTATRQPRIVNAGTVERENGDVCLRWVNGSSHHLTVSRDSLNISQPISTFSVSKLTAASGINASILFDNNSATNTPFRFSASGTEAPANTFFLYTNTVGGLTSCGAQNANQNLFTTISQTATTPNNEARLNGTEVDNNIGTVTNSLNGLTIGNIRPGAGAGNLAIYDWSGWIFELVIYNSNESSNRSGIETNINSYYGIY
jgi:hypothetical protein